ncbi:MAG: hypothetical protein HPY50_02085 [Firmicutes bacterium]|nr:hypothetical protein [Bacillota bacterium]
MIKTEGEIYSMVPTSEAYLLILSKPELLHLWNTTEWSLPNCIIEPYSVPEYGNLTGTYYERPDYVGSVINKVGAADGKQFAVSIVIGKSALLADIAHEVAHLYIHSKLGYPLIWLSPDLWASFDQLTTYQHAAHFYASAVHPVIDDFLKDINLFNR